MNLYDRLISLQFTWRDAVDVIVVAVIIYNILALVRGTRAMQVSIGLMLLGSTYFVAQAFDLPALEAISAQILFYLPFAVIVLFQQEIRRGLAQMVSNPILAVFGRPSARLPYDAILNAVDLLSSRQIGALIVIEGSQTLRMYEDGAKQLDALVTMELLVSIFTPGGPLHDGAVIVRGNRVAVAGAFLPLTSSNDPKLLQHGTRHRAALGLSEESDAFVIVISEENRSVATASEGALTENVDRAVLMELLTRRFGAPA